jgi:AcrR family transcriptional regulator
VNKRALTRERILLKGVEYASRFSLFSITIGEMAKASLMSRTGVISHFKDKEDMQISILQYTESLFIERVLKKSYTSDPVENLHNLKRNWLNWISFINIKGPASCPFIKAAIEYKDRDSSVIKKYMVNQQQRLLAYLTELIERAVASGDLRQDTNAQMFAYEFYSLYIGHSIQKNLEDSALGDERFFLIIDQLISRHKNI